MTMTMTTLLLALLVGHALCDYGLQTQFIADNKARSGPVGWLFWPWCLSAHAALHGGAVALAVGMLLATAARWCRSALVLRLLFLLAGACWVAHDLLTGSTFGLLADLLCMTGLVVGALRDRRATAPA